MERRISFRLFTQSKYIAFYREAFIMNDEVLNISFY